MKPARLRPFVIVALALVLGLSFVYPLAMVSPGPLLQAHEGLVTDCFACHAPWRGPIRARCIDCHALADIGVRSTRGIALARPNIKASFHAQLAEGDCLACHGDHQGREPSHSSRTRFGHELLRAAARAGCDACHLAPTDHLHRVLNGNCSECHGQQRWEPAKFEHDRLFVLDDLHRTRCEKCHAERNHRIYTCFGCHEHPPEEMTTRHVGTGIVDVRQCARCHHGGGTKVTLTDDLPG